MSSECIYIPQRDEWQDREVQVLKVNYGRVKVVEIMKLIHRSESSINTKARALGLKSPLKGFQKGHKPKNSIKGYKNNGSFKKGHTPLPRVHNPYYSKEEIVLMKQFWGKLSPSEMMKALPNRTWKGISIKASRLGLKAIKPTTPEKRFLSICQTLKLPLKYVGNSNKFIVARLKPDFIHSEGRKLAVDIFGVYWHSPLYARKVTACRFLETRKSIFEKHGWKLIVFWDTEVMSSKAVEIVKERLSL